MRQHEPVVQGCTPADEGLNVGFFPEHYDQGTQQVLLGKAHSRVWRHLERSKLDEAQTPCRSIWREHFVDADLGPVRVACDVDEQISENAIDQPGGDRACAWHGDLRQCDLHLVERFVTGLSDPGRLARRSDEKT